MDFLLSDVELFLAFADAHNAQDAARSLGLSSPTFNDRLRALETRLPQAPFSWRGRKRILSPYGERLASELRPLAANLRRSARMFVVDGEGSLPPRFRITGRSEILSRLACSAPTDLRFLFTPRPSGEALRALLAGEVDIAITQRRPAAQDVVILKLFEPSAAWICSPNLCPQPLLDVWESDGTTPWDSCRGLPWIAYREDDGLLDAFARHTGLGDLRSGIRVLCEDWTIIRDLVSAGRGAAVVPLEAVSPLDPLKVKHVRVPMRIRLDAFYAVYRKELARATRGTEVLRWLRSCVDRKPQEGTEGER